MRFVSRNEWRARRPKATTRLSGPVRGVTLHWEGPHMGSFPHRQCDNKVRQIQDFHMDGRGWSDIAYTGLPCPHGYVFEGRGPNLRTAANGTNDGNDHWLALCYLGGQGDPLTAEGKQAFKDGVDWLRRNGAGDRVNGHRDHKATECPGDVIYRWLRATNWKNLGEDWLDMPSKDDLDAIARAVLRADMVPSGNEDNPTWQLKNALGVILRQNRAIVSAMEAMADELTPAVKDAVRAALAEATVQVDVNVTGGDQA